MRDIKFRGLDSDNNWVYGGYYKESKNGCEYITIDDFDTAVVVRETIGQLTGLKDCNGVGIYDGDVVKDDEGFNRHVTFGPYGVDADGYDSGGYYDGYVPATFPWDSFEVIGNIHENPELIKEER